MEEKDRVPGSDQDNTPEQAETPAQAEIPKEKTIVLKPVWGNVPDPVALAEQKKEYRRSKRVFVTLFCAVFGFCLLLLCGLLFLGDGGFSVIKTQLLQKERIVYVREYDEESGLLTPNEAAHVIAKSTVTVVTKTAGGGGASGSGFVYDRLGHICTNYHVIENSESVQVILPDGTATDAEVVGYDKYADLAVLRVPFITPGLVPAVLGSSDDLLVGDSVVAVGTPVELALGQTATFGTVSSVNRLLPITDATGTVTHKLTLIQTDTSVNHGNSGGPLGDMYGRVVGIVARKMESTVYTYEGLGFAIPIDGAKVILDEIIQNGTFTGESSLVEGRSQLGLSGHGGQAGKWYLHDPLTGGVAEVASGTDGAHYMPEDGVYVLEVTGENVKSKVRAGDVIVRIDGLRMTTIQDVIDAVNRRRAGESVRMTLVRGGTTLSVTVELTAFALGA